MTGTTPNQLSDLLFWYKADAITGLANGAALSGNANLWPDSGPNGWHITSFAGTDCPTYSTAGPNGLPCVTQDGNGYLHLPAAALAAFADKPGATVYALVSANAATHALYVLHASTGSSGNAGRFNLNYGSGGAPQPLEAGGRRLDTDTYAQAEIIAALNENVWYILSGKTDWLGDSASVRSNGGAWTTKTSAWGSSGNSATAASVEIDIGGNPGASPTSTAMSITELFAFGRALPDHEAGLMDTYLMERSAVTVADETSSLTNLGVAANPIAGALSIAITTAAPAGVGDTVLVPIELRTVTTPVTVTDSAGNAYSFDYGPDTVGVGLARSVLTTALPIGSTITASWTDTGETAAAMVADVYPGTVAPTAPVAMTAISGGAVHSATVAQTAQDFSYVVDMASGGETSATVAAPFTTLGTSLSTARGLVSAYAQPTTTGNVTFTCTWPNGHSGEVLAGTYATPVPPQTHDQTATTSLGAAGGLVRSAHKSATHAVTLALVLAKQATYRRLLQALSRTLAQAKAAVVPFSGVFQMPVHVVMHVLPPTNWTAFVPVNTHSVTAALSKVANKTLTVLAVLTSTVRHLTSLVEPPLNAGSTLIQGTGLTSVALAVTRPIPAGDTVFVALSLDYVTAPAAVSLVDDVGNTYAIDVPAMTANGMLVAHAVAATTLGAGQHITASWTGTTDVAGASLIADTVTGRWTPHGTPPMPTAFSITYTHSVTVPEQFGDLVYGVDVAVSREDSVVTAPPFAQLAATFTTTASGWPLCTAWDVADATESVVFSDTWDNPHSGAIVAVPYFRGQAHQLIAALARSTGQAQFTTARLLTAVSAHLVSMLRAVDKQFRLTTHAGGIDRARVVIRLLAVVLDTGGRTRAAYARILRAVSHLQARGVKTANRLTRAIAAPAPPVAERISGFAQATVRFAARLGRTVVVRHATASTSDPVRTLHVVQEARRLRSITAAHVIPGQRRILTAAALARTASRRAMQARITRAGRGTTTVRATLGQHLHRMLGAAAHASATAGRLALHRKTVTAVGHGSTRLARGLTHRLTAHIITAGRVRWLSNHARQLTATIGSAAAERRRVGARAHAGSHAVTTRILHGSHVAHSQVVFEVTRAAGVARRVAYKVRVQAVRLARALATRFAGHLEHTASTARHATSRRFAGLATTVSTSGVVTLLRSTTAALQHAASATSVRVKRTVPAVFRFGRPRTRRPGGNPS